jgi:transposase-like protein
MKDRSRSAQARLQWMLFYFFNGRNAQRTCRHFGISRQTFYRWKRRFDRHDLCTLEERSHRPRQARRPMWSAELAERVLALRKQYPRWGKDKLAVLLRKEQRTVSTSMVGRLLVDLKRRGALHEPPKAAARSHRTHNEEFYQVQAKSDQVPVLNRQLRCWEKTYNCIPPHQSLAYLTPLEFITRWKRNLRKRSVTNLLTSTHSF